MLFPFHRNNKVRLYNGLQTRNEVCKIVNMCIYIAIYEICTCIITSTASYIYFQKLDTSFTPVDVRPYHLPSFVNESDCEQDYELAKSTSVETDTSILPQLERLAQL